MTDAHFLAAEGAIVERLREQCPEARAVSTAADMQAIEQRQQTTPALYVLYDGYEPEQAVGRGRVQRVTQRWLVVAAVRNVAAPHRGDAARDAAGPLLTHTLEALQGWTPARGYSPLRLQDAPGAQWMAGFAYFPTAWTTELTTRGGTTDAR